MNDYRYNMIKEKESLIEEKRLMIKKLKNEKSKLHDLMDTIGNIYEYFAAPLCAISISLSALLSGPIVYALPIAMAIGAISVVSYKFILRKKLEKLSLAISDLKKERQEAYNQREKLYEDIFNDLQNENLDKNDYYHQILNASNACQDLTNSMIPYKNKKKKYVQTRNIVSKLFDYGLAPVATVVVPLVCSLTGMGVIGQIITMASSSGLLLGCASIDDALTKKIDQLDDNIIDIKNDRTVKYVERDIKLKESLEYLKKYYENIKNNRIDNYQKRKETLKVGYNKSFDKRYIK